MSDITHRWDEAALTARLLGRIALGDREAMSQFYSLYEAAIYRLALAVLDDAPAAAGVLTQVMIDVYRDAGRILKIDNVRAWLLGVTLERAHAPVACLHREGASVGGLPRDGRVDRALLNRRAEDVLRVHAALHELPPDQRAVLHLAYCENLPDTQIAEVLGCADHVASRLHASARRMLECHLAA